MNMTTDATAKRQAWMSLLAKSRARDLARLWAGLGDNPGHTLLRAPEIGGVMVRGRAGAVGAAFNLGEMTVTRCSVKLDSGEVGHAYVQGRDKTKALQAALADALMQTDQAARIEAQVLLPLRTNMASAASARAAKAAATKVDFFTMVRGED